VPNISTKIALTVQETLKNRGTNTKVKLTPFLLSNSMAALCKFWLVESVVGGYKSKGSKITTERRYK
jgi:hypothetical protein